MANDKNINEQMRRKPDGFKESIKVTQLPQKINPAELIRNKPVNKFSGKVLSKTNGTAENTLQENVRVTQFELLKQWEKNREAGVIQAGTILATYANIYLPIKNGVPQDTMYRAFSFQWSDFVGNYTLTDDMDFVIYDFPLFENSYSTSPDNPFLFLSEREFIKESDYYNFDRWHVGLLSQSALQRIIDAVNGRGWLMDVLVDTEGLVFYRPEDWMWYDVDNWESLAIQKKSQNKPLLAAAAATIIDMM